MQLLFRIAILCAKYNIRVQAYLISTKQNSIADILSRDQYLKNANKYSALQKVNNSFRISWKDGIWKYPSSKFPSDYLGMVWHLILGKYTIPQWISILNITHSLKKRYCPTRLKNLPYGLVIQQEKSESGRQLKDICHAYNQFA